MSHSFERRTKGESLSYRFLSHTLKSTDPMYGGREGFSFLPEEKGGRFSMPLHMGTHMDAPKHFFSEGLTVDQIAPQEFLARGIQFVDLSCEEGELISFEKFNLSKKEVSTHGVEAVLIRTGFSKFRDQEVFWKKNPGISKELASQLRELYPDLRWLGVDTISISSYSHREVGREVHEIFLKNKKPILLLEDLNLEGLKDQKIEKIFIAPLRIQGADGGPVTVIAKLFERGEG